MTTDRALLDALARDVADALDALTTDVDSEGNVIVLREVAGAAAAIRARHAAPAEAEKRWWYVVDRKGQAIETPDEHGARAEAACWDKAHPGDAPHRAILAVDADDARAQYAAMEAGTVVVGTVASASTAPLYPMNVGGAPTPPADDADAGARLVDLLTLAGLSKSEAKEARNLAREVVRQRDEARREARRAQRERDGLQAAGEMHVARADAAEKERDEARRALDVQLTYSAELQRIIEALKRGEVYQSESATHHVEMAREIVNRADAAEAQVRELRALCVEAEGAMSAAVEWGLGVESRKRLGKAIARLRAAAAAPASEGVRDGL